VRLGDQLLGRYRVFVDLLLREPQRVQALQAWAAALGLQGLQPLQLFCIDFAYAAR